MREIRFRFVFKHRETGELEIKYYSLGFLISMALTAKADPILLDGNYTCIARDQYIGEYDRSGFDIYEGDIVKFDFGVVGSNSARIVFENGCWGLYWIDSKHPDDLGFKALWNAENKECDWQLEGSEIIGNIYENPELISGSTGEESVQQQPFRGEKND